MLNPRPVPQFAAYSIRSLVQTSETAWAEMLQESLAVIRHRDTYLLLMT